MKLFKQAFCSLAFAILAGCGVDVPTPKIPLDHPANPQAEAASLPSISKMLESSADLEDKKVPLDSTKMQHHSMPRMKM